MYSKLDRLSTVWSLEPNGKTRHKKFYKSLTFLTERDQTDFWNLQGLTRPTLEKKTAAGIKITKAVTGNVTPPSKSLS
jgi:hypothetical protein